METDGEGGGGGGEAERRGSELGRLLETIGSSEVLEKRIPLIKQLEEEFSADHIGLILKALLASWVDSTCSGVSHCTLHRSILQVALKCSDLDITDHLRQFLTLGAKASSWCGKHLQCSAKCIDQSHVLEEEDHNRLCQEVNSLSLSISTKLLDIAAKGITVPGLEVAEGEEGQGAAQEECVLNKADDAFPTLVTMAMGMNPDPEVSQRCTHCVSEKTSRWRPGPDGPGTMCNACWQKGNPRHHWGHPSIKSRRCMHCSSEKTPRWLRGPDGPATLCSACGQRFLKGRLLQSNPIHRRGRRLIKGRRCMHCASEKTPTRCPGLDGPAMLRNACGKRRFMKGRLLHSNPRHQGRPSNNPQQCMHCGSESTIRWLRGPDGPATLCNACGQRFLKGRLHSNSPRGRGRSSKKRLSSSKDDLAAGNDVVGLAEAQPCGVGASLDAFFDDMVTGPEVPCGEAGAERADDEEELEWLSNKDAFPSVETMAVELEEEASAPDVPRARAKGRRRVTAMETTRRQANVRAQKDTVRWCTHCATEKTSAWRHGPEGPRTLCNACGAVFRRKGLPSSPPAAKETVRRCTRCAREKTPQWREGPEGPLTLCNACGLAFRKTRRLLPENRPANSPALSPSGGESRALKMLCRNETSATGEMQVVLMDPPANGPTSSPLERTTSLCRLNKEEISAADHVAAAQVRRGEESMEVQLLPERLPVDNPAFSLVSRSPVLKRRRKSEAATFAAIRATAKAGRADRAAARLAAMDN